MSETTEAASFEACLDALGNVERRRVLLSLLDDGSERDRGVRLDRIGPEASDGTLGVSMHHVHLPKLERLGFVEADRRRRSVTPGPRFEEIRPLLRLLDENRATLPDGLV